MAEEQLERGIETDTEEEPISAPLEEKYQQQMRQILPQKIELPISTLVQMIESQIELAPDFQRRDRWDTKRQSRFIESIIMNVPIPPVFLGEDEYGRYVVLDGRQRLTALYNFLKNLYPLVKLQVWPELNGKRFFELQKEGLDTRLTRRFLPAVVLLKESSPIVKYDVFDRLNTGGVEANPMEIRNAVYRGEFSSLLKELADNNFFRQLWGIPLDDKKREDNNTYRMMEDVELVLRFFALKDSKRMNMKFGGYLGEYMNERNKEYAKDPALESQDRTSFEWAVTNTWAVFGPDSFRKPPKGNKSVPLSDSVLVSLCDVNPKDVTAVRAQAIRGGYAELLKSNDEFIKAITAGTNGKGAIDLRLKKGKEVVAKALQLAGA